VTIPGVVERDIDEAVRSAIQFGVSAADFKACVVSHWAYELEEKRKRDLQELRK